MYFMPTRAELLLCNQDGIHFNVLSDGIWISIYY